MATIPRKHDILLGKGNSINTHYGNRHYRSLVEAHQANFTATAKRSEKRRIVADIMADIKQLGGRFLMEDPRTRAEKKSKVRHQMPAEPFTPEGFATDPYLLDKVWIVVEEDKATEKVMHRLRERKAAAGEQPQKSVSGEKSVAAGGGPEEADAIRSSATASSIPNAERKVAAKATRGSSTANEGSSQASLPPGIMGSIQAAGQGLAPNEGISGGSAQATGSIALPAASLSLTSLFPSMGDLTQATGPTINTQTLSLGGLGTAMAGPSTMATMQATMQTSGSATAEGFLQSVLQAQATHAPVLPPAMQTNGSATAGGLLSLLQSQATNNAPVLFPIANLGVTADSSGFAAAESYEYLLSLLRSQATNNATAEGYLQSVLQSQATNNAPRLPPQPSLLFGSGGVTHSARPTNVQSAIQLLGSTNVGGLSHAAGLLNVQPALQSLGAATALAGGDNASAVQPPVVPTRNSKGPPEVPTPMSMQQWIGLANERLVSRDVYLKNALSVAISLVERAVQLAAEGAIAAADIANANLAILVDGTTVRGVQFQTQNRQPSGAPASSGTVCAALGSILLELFSRGQSHPQGAPSIAADNLSQITDTSVPPAQRRRISAPSGGPASAVAHSMQLDLGMPTAIVSLVRDLLMAVGEHRPESAFRTLDEVLTDLTLMKEDPEHYLFDRTCPQRALDDTGLFTAASSRLFGREKEIEALMTAKKKIANHVFEGEALASENESEGKLSFGRDRNDFLGELVLLSGYAGSGKSSLIQALRQTCEDEQWFVLHVKNEKAGPPPIMTMLKALDDLIGTWATRKISHSHEYSGMLESFDQVCQSISSTTDEEGLRDLSELIPSLAAVFPEILAMAKGDQMDTSSTAKVGFTAPRFGFLVHSIVHSFIYSGRPVLFAFDDLQWGTSLDGLKDFILNHNDASDVRNTRDRCHPGLLIAGAYRSNEMEGKGALFTNLDCIGNSDNASVSTIAIGELSEDAINELISQKLCLPARYTKNLASLVLSKTRGNPFFVRQFLKTIVQNGMLKFSVQHRRWMWDCDVIDMLMISDDVAGLLIASFNQLPSALLQAAMIASCFGSQVEEFTMAVLNSDPPFLHFDLVGALQLAVQAGIMEKAGPVYQFTHDIIQQTIYEGAPMVQRRFLHKSIGEKLLGAAADNPALYSLAVDQINIYGKGAALSSEERSHYAICNAAAAKSALSTNRFDGARSYITTGISMLNPGHWENQYRLSLELYEMSASVSCTLGDVDTMSSCLTEINANVKSFEDSLTSSILLAKLLAASAKFDEAVNNILTVLSNLGEDFPKDIDMNLVLSELSVLQTTLANITAEQVKLLPRMTKENTLHAMKFMSMLCSFSIMAKPLLAPILSCRMVRLTIEQGFCDDSIVGLVTAGHSLFSFTDEIALAYRIGNVADALIEESPNRNALKARLVLELTGTLKAFSESPQSVVSDFPEMYNAAMCAGDVPTAMNVRRLFCTAHFISGHPFAPLWKHYVDCIKLAIKYKQNAVLYAAMSSFHPLIHLSGRDCDEVEIKSVDELNEIATESGNTSLLYQLFINSVIKHFWMGEYATVIELTDKRKPTKQKRTTEVLRLFCKGLSSLILARQTRDKSVEAPASPLKSVGEEALEKVTKMERISGWNLGLMSYLLKAELAYLNGELESAEEMYNASIAVTRDLKWMHYEALALELYGKFCVGNGFVERGRRQLTNALEKYKRWGAMRKFEQLQHFIDSVDKKGEHRS